MIDEILNAADAQALRSEVWDTLGGGCTIDDIESIFDGYGLEMDALFDMF